MLWTNPKEFNFKKDDNVHSITVLHYDEQIHNIEIITEQRCRFSVGIIREDAYESNVDFEIKSFLS